MRTGDPNARPINRGTRIRAPRKQNVVAVGTYVTTIKAQPKGPKDDTEPVRMDDLATDRAARR